VHFDTALNLAWLALGVSAFSVAVRTTVRARRGHAKAPPGFQFLGVVFIVAALLFPYFSATDDIVRIENFDFLHSSTHTERNQHQPQNKRSRNSELIRLYETMDTPLISAASILIFALFFVRLVVPELIAFVGHDETLASGRSPPLPA
jgi:hypothetical protein